MLSLWSSIFGASPVASNEIVLHLEKRDGSVEQKRVPIDERFLRLCSQQYRAVPDNIVQLTRVTSLALDLNAFTEFPSCVLSMTQLTALNLSANRLIAIPREIGRLTALNHLFFDYNLAERLPIEIDQLASLQVLGLIANSLTSLPAELGQLTSLRQLYLSQNHLAWLPSSLDRLPAWTEIYLNGNPLPIAVGDTFESRDSRAILPELFAVTTALAMIRHEATTVAIGLQDLELPALVTLEILDMAFPNSIPMHKKWDLVVAVKHFHERRAQ